MTTPITATFPALNFPKEVDYPTQEDWAAFSAAAELNYGILSGEWSLKSELFKNQMNTLAQQIQDIGENAINAITFDNIAQLKLNSNMGRVDVLGYYIKGDGGGGTFYWDASSTETDNGGCTIQATGITTGRWKRVFSGSVNIDWFGAKGDAILNVNTNTYSGTDNYNIIQNVLLLAQANQWNIEFSNKKYLITQGLITPFGNYQTTTSNKIIGNGATLVSNISLSSITNSTFTAISTGYIDSNNTLQISTGVEEHLTSNIVIENLNFSHFGRAFYAHNMIYGSALRDINVYNCFNGISLTRCFYLVLDNIFLFGIDKAIGSVGFSTNNFSNVIENRGIKVIGFDIGLSIGGMDGCKFTTVSAEGCNYGIVVSHESSVFEIDTAYLEGNAISNFEIRALIKNCTITNSWFYGEDKTKYITSTLTNSSYANINLINNRFNLGLESITPQYNIYGTYENNVDPLNDSPTLIGFPRIVNKTYRYNVDVSSSGYMGSMSAIKQSSTGGLVPFFTSGSHVSGVNTSTRTFGHSSTLSSGIYTFDTDFNYVSTSIIIWSVSIAHNTGVLARTFIIIPEVTGLLLTDVTFKVYYSDSVTGTLKQTTIFTVSNNSRKIRIVTQSFTTPSLYHSYMRLI